MINVTNVSKVFGSFKAIRNVSFEIQRGEIVGFLGQNGAGKTTLMRMITSFYSLTNGSITIDGIDVAKKSIDARRKIGYLPETPPLYPNLTPQEYLRFAAKLKDVPSKIISQRVNAVMDQCDILDVKQKSISKLSKGYKQRVGIAQAIINDPEVLILDEPMNGLDPIQIKQVRALIKNLQYKRTVIVSTHILSEAEKITDRVIILKSGQILEDLPLEQLYEKYNSLGENINLENIFLKLTDDSLEVGDYEQDISYSS